MSPFQGEGHQFESGRPLRKSGDQRGIKNCPDAGIGRQVRFRSVCPKGVEVQVPLGAQIYLKIYFEWAGGEIGIHVVLRRLCRKAWRFKSSPAHIYFEEYRAAGVAKWYTRKT